MIPRNIKVNEEGETIIIEGQVENYYKIPYMVEEYDDKFIDSLINPNNGSKFHYPTPNPFIPINFDVIASKVFGKKGEEQQRIAQDNLMKNNSVTSTLLNSNKKKKGMQVSRVNTQEDSALHLIVDGRPFVLFVQGGPGTSLEGVCNY